MQILKTVSWLILPLLPLASLTADTGDIRLAEAARSADKDAIRSLLNQRVDVNVPLPDGSTALIWAAHWHDGETADLLIRAGAKVNVVNDYGVNALWEACNSGSDALVEELLTSGANPNEPLLRTGETALMRCARAGNAKAVGSLINHGADVNVKEKQKQQTALMWALEERHPEAARVLIEHGADVAARSKGGFTPLLFAIRQNDLESSRLLLEKGADVNEKTPGRLIPLLLAVDAGYQDLARLLIDKGADVNAADPNGLTALHYTLRAGISILRAVVHDQYGFPGLREYLLRPNMPDMVKVLLEHGANPNARIKSDLARVRQLDQPTMGLSGATPFLLAAATADLGIMRALLAKGADPLLAANDGTTPLMVAAGVGWRENRPKDMDQRALDAVKLLVDLGADVKAASKVTGLTALHGAAYTGNDPMVEFLVSKGAKLDAMDRFGQTPLSIAEGDPDSLCANDFGFGHPDVPQVLHPSTVSLLHKLAGDQTSKN